MQSNSLSSFTELCLMLTSQRASEQLHNTFKFALEEILGNTPFSLFVNSGTNICHSFYLVGDSIKNAEHVEILTRINLLDFSDWQDKSTDNRLYYPVLLDDRLFACVVILGELTDEEDRILFSMFGVYANTLAMINDSAIDGLTGLYNRKYFDIELANEMEKYSDVARRKDDNAFTEKSSFLAILDIDHFKLVNDTHGHIIGDEVLLKLSAVIRNCFRDIDGLFRYGGEEFAVIIRDISKNDIELVLNRFISNVREANFPVVSHITLSIGYFLLCEHTTPTEAISNADKALYYAKEHGRDQIANYDELVKSNKITTVNIDTDIELF